MNTTVTLSLQDIGMLLIGACLIILLVYLILLAKNMVASVKSANRILADVEVISEVAAKRSKDADKLMDEASDALSGIFDTLKGNQGAIKAVTEVFKGLISLKNLFDKRDSEQTNEREKKK